MVATNKPTHHSGSGLSYSWMPSKSCPVVSTFAVGFERFDSSNHNAQPSEPSVPTMTKRLQSVLMSPTPPAFDRLAVVVERNHSVRFEAASIGRVQHPEEQAAECEGHQQRCKGAEC